MLLGLFFVTIMGWIWPVTRYWIWVLLTLTTLLVAKSALIMALSRLFGSDAGTAIRTGLALGAGGEFGLVLLFEAGQARLLAPEVQQIALAALILSMLASPFIIERSEHMVRRFSGADWMYRAMALHTIAAQTMAAEGHVLICGYRRSGQNLALLERADHLHRARPGPERVRGGCRRAWCSAMRRAAVLMAAGLMRAKAW